MTGKQQVRQAVKELIVKGNELFPRGKIKYNELEIRFSLYGASRLGYANWSKRKLNFHKVLAETNTDEYIGDTVIHEVAHLYQRHIYPYSKSHGREFKRICKALGGNGSTTSNMNVKGLGKMKTRYIYECPVCGAQVNLTQYKHNKQEQTRRYVHSKCNRYCEPLVWTGNKFQFR